MLLDIRKSEQVGDREGIIRQPVQAVEMPVHDAQLQSRILAGLGNALFVRIAQAELRLDLRDDS